MPQMVSIQPVIPQGPPSGGPGPKEHSPFSPHLENALASKKSQQQAGQSKGDKKMSPSNDLNITADEGAQSLALEDSGTLDTTAGDSGNALLQNPTSSHLAYFAEGTSQTIPATSIVATFQDDASVIGDETSYNAQTLNATLTIQPETTPQTETTPLFSRFQQLPNAANLTQAAAAIIDKSSYSSETLDAALTIQPKTTPQTETTPLFSRFQQLPNAANLTQAAAAANLTQDAAAILTKASSNSETSLNTPTIQALVSSTISESETLNETKPGVSNKQDALLNQLQKIIDSAKETGSVSITKATNIPVPHAPRNNIHGFSTIPVAVPAEPVTISPTMQMNNPLLSGLVSVTADGMERTAGKPTQNWTGLRHDIQQQYFNAKNTVQNLAENNQNFQNNKQQGEEFSQQSMSSGSQSSIFTATESANTFSQISATLQPVTAQPVSELSKPILLPSGTIVQEDEVLRQLSERFQITGRNMDSRINIKLHPAELGELKIDLTVKEGSIRANVVAQSQQALQILEKNIQKLRNALEQQGFTIDEISLTAESESVGDFDLFDQQLFSQNDYTPTTKKSRQEGDATFSLEDLEIAAPVSNTGVNVKV